MEIRATRSRTVYENRWMRVREDAILRADGSTGIFGVVEKPDFALILPVDDAGHLYLVEQYRYPVGARYWEFPQGSWEESPDADPEDLARGELEEETGLRAGRLQHLGHLFEAYGFSNQGFHVYLATGLQPGTPSPTEEELGLRVERFSREQFAAMVRDGQIKDAPSVAAFGLLRMGAGHD